MTAVLIVDATRGFDALLNNDLHAAHAILTATDSAFHALGLGLVKFLEAALGQEDNDLVGALQALLKAETAATAQLVPRASDPPTPFEPGTEFKLLVALAVMLQALVHILSESYLESVKAIYKLNRAYKGFSAVYKLVFLAGVREDDSIAAIVHRLNLVYEKRTAAPNEIVHNGTVAVTAGSALGSWVGGWGKKRSHLVGLKHSSSTSTLPRLVRTKSKNAAPSEHVVAASAPCSPPDSILETDSTTATPRPTDESDEVPVALWKDDPLTSLVISGAAFGFGLFGLIFSLIPPKLRKVMAWFGFANANRVVSLKLLTVAACTSSDVNGAFASLSLVTYYCVILLMSGWQADEANLIQSCELVLSRVEERFPNGTLWILNRAKICRMKQDVGSAIAIIEKALNKDPNELANASFRQADSLLVFELSWCYLSNRDFAKSADSFQRMRGLNSWSHSTYVFISAGALLDLPLQDRTPEIVARIEKLFEELPGLIGAKRLMGEAPATEVFISRKLAYYKLKHTRWIAEGRILPSTKFWEVIRVSPASELGHFWNTTGRASPVSRQASIDHLAAFTPAPRYSPDPASPTSVTRPSPTAQKQAQDDLDSPDELLVRDLLLGSMYRSQGALPTARALLQLAMDAEPLATEDKWAAAFARFEMAVLLCQESERDDGTEESGKEVWKGNLIKADRLLDSIFAISNEYNLRSRLESKCQMLRDEISQKRLALKL